MLTEAKTTVLNSTLASSRAHLQSLPKRPAFGGYDLHRADREYHGALCRTIEEWLSDGMARTLSSERLSAEAMARAQIAQLMGATVAEVPSLIQMEATMLVLRIIAQKDEE